MNELQNTVEEQSAEAILAGKSKLRSFLLGIFIGLAVILPGISGSTVAIILGVALAPHCENKWQCSKYFIPAALQTLIYLSIREKSKLYFPSIKVIPTN